MLIDRKTQYCLDVSSSQFNLSIQYNRDQNLSKCFYGYQQGDSIVYKEWQKAE